MRFRLTNWEPPAHSEPNVEEFFTSSPGFRSATEAAAINHLIELQADDTWRRAMALVEAQRDAAVKRETLALAQATANRTKLAQAEPEFQQARSQRGSLLLALKGWKCVLVGGIIEFYVTLETLPYALNMKKYSLGGVMISLAPVIAMLVMGLGFSALFESLHAAHKNSAQKMRRVGWVCAALLYLGLGLLTVDVVRKLNPARIEATKARAAAGQTTGAAIYKPDQTRFDALLNAVTITLAVAGGAFFGLAHQESARLCTFGRSWVVLAVLRRRQKKYEARAAEATVNANDKRAAFAQREAQRQTARESCRSRLYVLQEQSASRPRPAEEIVASALAANVGKPRPPKRTMFIG